MLDNILLLILGILPCILLMVYVYSNDKVEKEPFYILFILFFSGCSSALLSYLITNIFINIFPSFNFNFNYLTTFNYISFFIVSFIEELFKWVFSLVIIWKNKNFNYFFDSIVYVSFLSLGFALVENLIYIDNYKSIVISMLRNITSLPTHLCLAIIMGYYLGKVKTSTNGKTTLMNLILSIIIPIIIHYCYNILLVCSNYYFIIFYLIVLSIFSIFIIKKYNNSKICLQKKN